VKKEHGYRWCFILKVLEAHCDQLIAELLDETKKDHSYYPVFTFHCS
jgi:hypothetical protein